MMPYEIVTTNAVATKLAKYLIKLPSVAWDTETFGEKPEALDWVRGESAWHQYSDGKKAWLIDVQKVDVQIFKPLLESPKVLKIIHSSAFDCPWTAREHKIYTKNICDTRLREQVILGIALPRELRKAEKERYEPLYSASLKWCLHRRGLPDKFKFEPFIKGQPLTKTQPIYMVRDVEFLHTLMMDQQEHINEMGLHDVDYLESRVAEITYQMMVNGFGVDVKGWLKYTEQEEKVFNECMEKLNKIAPINWNSWQQYCKFFGVNRTKDLDTLLIHKNEGMITHPKEREVFKALTLWREARQHFKNVNTYGKSWIAQHVHNGLVHCQYTQMVNTARYSCDKPNLQNIPSDTPHRSFMVPGHYKNGVFVIADFSGQEMAIMAYGSQEDSWLACLRSGGDLHSMVAEDILGDEWRKWDKAERARQRKIIKIINFSIAYGAGVETIALRAGVEPKVISMRLGMMERRYRKLFAWLKNNGNEAKRTWTSYSMPPFNRYRSLAMETEGWRRVNIGKNNIVQATAADMAKLAMYHMYQEIQSGLPALFIHMLHDELIVECSTSNAKRVAKKLVEAMNLACTQILGEPLSAPEIKIQKNWDKRKE
jgi:DNA polymerase I-like protein with 3'-5' exonuclease and polymerase domains